ncbi:ribosomal L7Ae/L30e/S12e/Gadd45 family protein [Anoxynatronum buryatiense]|uniref:Large subunit ribosomal protein L7A n=1 Tax=Anoxynatronum buryatiense TaxID=489973 RepID=A0AA46AKE9_9CLOT|nr:ribosomal L7Ae/L30e/S12e/Gadd45 family protein [Anoxynatronum buryatiense]SMP69769.1 large subunit ribosomal protein L7A [Anoxynatronum buryatiense]
MLELLQHEKKVVGIKQVTRSLTEGQDVKCVYLASDAETHLLDKMRQLALEKQVEVVPVESRKKLGKFCGIDVGATVVAVLK